ncbi:hypothetical protein PCIT_a4282 [Pseudoalteromonas citrea]|uniref:DUF3592 domain-containing protein n=2 Tax=Pseudoalteromonas citrea TaxID=43655 RepID=A0AAD4AIR1_9GAMM|nr:hypothetical protein [Pseudoalteromonas citrea]KAF7771221.1 hypothetical protein PCIT_a4282 [Pseudoalteromonas citrea]
MNWLLMLVVAMLFLTSLVLWQGKKKRLNKRVWRQVQVINLVTVKQHKAGPIELLGESSLLVEFMFLGQLHSCQTGYRQQLIQSFNSNAPTFILIDPNNPSQCYYNACQQTKYARLWVLVSFATLACFALSHILPKI